MASGVNGSPCLRLGLFVQVEDAAGQAHHDADENDQRHAVADAALADLLAQPHDEGRTGGQRQNGHQHKGGARIIDQRLAS